MEESCKIIRVNTEEKLKDESNLKEVDLKEKLKPPIVSYEHVFLR